MLARNVSAVYLSRNKQRHRDKSAKASVAKPIIIIARFLVVVIRLQARIRFPPPSPSPRPSSSPPDRASMFVASRNPRCLSESISSVRARARVSALLLVADELVARTLYSRMDYLCLLSRFTLRCVAQSTRLPVMNVSSPCVCLCISLKLDPGLRGARCAMRACERLVRFSSVLRAERTGNVAVAW